MTGAESPARSRFGWPVVACLVVALGLGVAGAAGLARADAGTVTRAVTVDGVPMWEVSPADPASAMPGAVIAHGFAGSATLMRGFADTLAAHGYVAVLPDLTGHGGHTARLPVAEPPTATDPLQQDLAVAVDHLRGLPTVDASRIVLVGHSMGAGAVVRYAAEHPEIVAAVAISLGSTDTLPDDPALPRNLLLIVGGAEFARFSDAALAAARAADPSLSFGETTGDPASGTARRAVSVSGVEHISVLYATATHAETAAWLGQAVAAPGDGPPRPRDRLVPAGLLLLAFLVGFVPLAAVLPVRAVRPAGTARVTVEPVPAQYAYGGLAAALVLAAAGAAAAPTNSLPLAVGGYAAGFFAIIGLSLIGAYALAQRSAPAWRPAFRAGPRQVVAAAVLVAYAAAAVSVPLHLGVTHAVPVGARWWLLPLVVGCLGLLLVGAELIAAGTRWRQAVILAATAGALLGATLVGLAPGFVLLVLPLLVVLLAWHAGWSALLRRHAAPVWLPALVGATLVGWPVTMSLPLAG